MISQKATLHNRFDFEIYDIETGETEYTQAENIVLNNMWTRLCASSSYFGYIGVGTGSGTLSASRTTLFSHLAYKSATAVETVFDTDTTAHVTKSITFSETEAIGTWTEVGLMYGTSSSNYVTHALITDAEGDPITIDKTNTKIVTIYATVFAELLSPPAGQYNVAIGSQNAILSYLLAPASSSPRFMFTSLLKTDGFPALFGTLPSTVPANFTADAGNKRIYTALERLPTESNNQQIRGITLEPASPFRNSYGGINLLNALFPKRDYVGVALGTGDGNVKQFDFPIPLIKSGSEKIYIAGVLKTRNTDYTVRYGPRSTDAYLWEIVTSAFIGNDTTLDETVVLPQSAGDEAIITAIEMKNGTTTGTRMTTYDIKLSVDGVSWVNAGSAASWSANAVVTLNSFTPAAYKYMRVIFTAGSSFGSLSYVKIHITPPTTKHIVFTNPPAIGAAITADFSTEYINKTANFVLDVQAEILFGEGV